MPTTTKAGATNAWLELEQDYVPAQQAEDVPEVSETADQETQVVPDPQPRKRAARGRKADGS